MVDFLLVGLVWSWFFGFVCLFVWVFLHTLLDVETERDLVWGFHCSSFSSISAFIFP